jgi:hypothetical protein
MKQMYYLAFAVLMINGCSTSKEPEEARHFYAVPVRVSGGNIPQDSQEKVLFSPVVKGYALGRYVDPGNVLHLEHTVYRKEVSSTWNLSPNPDMLVPKTDLQKAGEIQYGNPYLAEVEKTLGEYQAKADELSGKIEQIEKNNAAIKSKDKDITKIKKTNKLLRESMLELTQHIDDLKTQLDVMKDKQVRQNIPIKIIGLKNQKKQSVASPETKGVNPPPQNKAVSDGMFDENVPVTKFKENK